MVKLYAFFILATLFLLCSAPRAQAQELQATVTVNYDQLPIDKREEVATMKEDVESYLNNTQYTGKEWEGGRIPVDITIYIMGKTGNTYQARLFVIAKRVLDGSGAPQSITWRLYDDEWHFTYARNSVFTYQTLRFDPFSSLLDFYMHLVVGMDADTYGELDGTAQYTKARELWQLGSSSGGAGYDMISEPGSFTRYHLVTELNDLSFAPFRKAIFAYFVDGMDKMESEKQQGLQALDGVLTDMVRFKDKLGRRSTLMQAFFDAKHQELADLFRDYAGKRDVFTKLRYLDPSHTSIYEDAEEGR